MLHWLAGQREADRDDAEHAEPPETPAPIFAVRAFKHAIFGTPSSVAAVRQRRNSNVDKDLARSTATATRPVLTRPKSANDAMLSARVEDFPTSPTKGILLTPGTVGGRGKTVTFGDHIGEKGQRKDDQAEVSRKRVDPFDALAATESRRHTSPERAFRKQRLTRQCVCCEGELEEEELATITDKEPECAVGRYWKREYDIYRDNTSREVRKLLTKQKAAKSFAREKDEQCNALSEELQRERDHVDRLESRACELEAAMKEMRAHLEATKTTDVGIAHGDSATRSGMSDRLPGKTTQSMLHSETTSNEVSPDNALMSLDVSTKHNEQRTVTASITRGGKRPSIRARHDSLDPYVSGVPGERTCMSQKHLPSHAPESNDVPIAGQQNSDGSTISKENLSPLFQAPPFTESHISVPPEVQKGIVSREGEVIPPDRVAAARARLAARRQQRLAP